MHHTLETFHSDLDEVYIPVALRINVEHQG